MGWLGQAPHASCAPLSDAQTQAHGQWNQECGSTNQPHRLSWFRLQRNPYHLVRQGIPGIQTPRQAVHRKKLAGLHEIPVEQAGTISPWLDGLLRYLGAVPWNPGNRRLDTAQNTAVLLETVALVPYQDSESSKAWYATWHCHPCGHEQKWPVGDVPKTCRPNRSDQPMPEGSRSTICQRTVGEDPLPGYGPVILSNRPVRTRMPGGVGAGGEKPPATRLGIAFPHLRERREKTWNRLW